MKPTGEVLWRPAEHQPVVARIAIAGDFLPAGRLAIPESHSWRQMASGLTGLFNDVSATFVNLECCLDSETLQPRTLCGLGDIVTAPADSLDYLKEIQTVAVGMANNHSFDFGEAGIQRTRSAVSQHKMIPLGAGRTTRDLPEIFVWKGPGAVRVGFWASASATLDPAKPMRAGVEPASVERGRIARQEMKKLGATVCVALLHAGCLRTNRPDPEQFRLMDSFATSGFDLVAASHSHRISGYSQLVGGGGSPSFCFYGLGSIVSGYASSPLEREGLITVAGLDHHGRMASLEVRPVLLGTNGFGAAPPVCAAGREILHRFRALSEEVADGSWKRRFYREISQGLLHLYSRDVKAAYRSGGVGALAAKAGRIRGRHVRRLVHRVIG
jgi:poly-gamma-glutamate synthesis protein (capsule biosynthesis protein)